MDPLEVTDFDNTSRVGDFVQISAVATISQNINLHWLVQYEAIIKVLPYPLCGIAVVSNLIAFVIAANLKSDQASVTTLKYMAVFDALHSVDMIQNIAVQTKCKQTIFQNWFLQNKCRRKVA